jgi:hypothetical protein
MITVPKQKSLGDLLYVRRCQLPVRLTIDQRERAHGPTVVPPAMPLLARMTAPSAHPVVLRRRRAIRLLDWRRCRLSLRQNSPGSGPTNYESRRGGKNSPAHSISP